MSGYLRRLATTGAAYTAASILSKVIAVALLPLYTRYLTPEDYGAAEILFAAVVLASIVVRLGLIEAILRFYYKDDEDPRAGRRGHLRRPLLALDPRRPAGPSLRRPDLRSAARRIRPRAGADRDRRPLGADDVGVHAHPLPPRRAGAGLLRHHDPQRRRGDRPHRGPGRRSRRGRPRPAARQLRDRRRFCCRPDRPAVAPPLACASTSRCSGASSASALPTMPAEVSLYLLNFVDRLIIVRTPRPRRGRPLLAGGEVRPGGQRPRPRLPARLAAARLLDPRRRRGPPHLRHRGHPLRRRLRLRRHRHVAVLALDRPCSWRRRNISTPTKRSA